MNERKRLSDILRGSDRDTLAKNWKDTLAKNWKDTEAANDLHALRGQAMLLEEGT